MMLVLTVFFQYANGKVLRIMIEQKLAVHENGFCRLQIVKKMRQHMSWSLNL